MGADNQQERPSGIASYYITGFVDGEGCFSVTIQKSNNVKLGIQIIPEFHVSQHQNRTEALREIKRVFGCGYIKPNDPTNPGDLTSVYVVRNINDLRNKVVSFFKRYPFISIKRKDFEKFSQIVSLMEKGEHLRKDGLIAILKIEDVISVLESSETVRQNK